MAKAIHPVAGGLALLTVLSFWLSTVAVEVFGSVEAITLVKTTIPWGLLILIPAMALAGVSGQRVAKRRRGPLVNHKKKRMPFIAANGVLILVPSAIFLSFKAQAGTFDAAFYVVQALELAAGAVNITLLGLNMRDGFRLTGKLSRRPSVGR